MINFGMNSETFRDQYQERRPIVFRGAFAKGQISWDAINNAVSRCDATSDSFRISFPDGNVSKEKYVDTHFHVGELRRVLNKSAVYDYLQKGATIVANSIFEEPAFNDYAKDIAFFTGRQTITSAYIAFGEKNSYREHWDSRDVFAVQLIGRKSWTIYAPTFDFPLYMHQSKYLEEKYKCPTEPAMEEILTEGDVLYIPRGWWHNVVPLGEPTVHLAVGTFPPYAVDYAKWIFRQLPEIVEARRALDCSKEEAHTTIDAMANEIAKRLRSPENFRQFLEDHYSSQRLETPLSLQRFGQKNTDDLPVTTLVKLNILNAGLTREYISSPSGRINFKGEIEVLGAFLLDNPNSTMGQIYGLMGHVDTSKTTASIRELAHLGVVELY